MITQKRIIPEQSILKNEEKSFGYVDSFQDSFAEQKQKIHITQIVDLFSSSGPKWANALLTIRDKIVGLFGLKTSDQITGKQKHSNTNYEPGSQHGIFKILHKTDNEIVLGEDDKHLNVRVSLLLEPSIHDIDKKLSITTAVKFNNLFGKFYFLPVKPLHQLIVRRTLKNIIRQIDSR